MSIKLFLFGSFSRLCRCQYTRGRSILLWLFTELAIIGADVQAVIGCAVSQEGKDEGRAEAWEEEEEEEARGPSIASVGFFFFF